MGSPMLHLSCPAKVNLALSVGSPVLASGGGMHSIASWMVAVNFSDSLMLEKLKGDHSEFDIAFDEDEETHQPIATVDWPLEKDLCFRAHALLEQHLGKRLPTRLRLRKRIPPGAGLGGGSSNAAQTLVGLDRLYDLHVHPKYLLDISRQLGSDVAFGLGVARGIKSAIVTGLGDEITPAPRKDTIDFVLIFPPFGCPTGPVYKAFDQLHSYAPSETELKPADVDRVQALASSPTVAQHASFNDLAEPACIVRPQLRDLKAQLESTMSLPIHITGSGSTMFLIAPSALTAKVLARKVTATTGLRAVATRTL